MEILSFNEWKEHVVNEGYNRAVIPKGGWVDLEGEDLPQAAIDFITDKMGNKNHGWNWIEAFYRGDMETTKEWVIVTDNGDQFKDGAQFMIWNPKKDKAVTTDEEYVKILKNLLK